MQRRANWAAEAVVSRPLLTALRTCWTDCYSMEDASNPLPALAGSDLLAHDIDLDPEFEDVVNDAVEITDCHDDGSDNEVGGSKTIVDGGWEPGARANNVSGEFCISAPSTFCTMGGLRRKCHSVVLSAKYTSFVMFKCSSMQQHITPITKQVALLKSAK